MNYKINYPLYTNKIRYTTDNNNKTMQYKNIPYEYREWTASNGQKCSSYTCKYFNFYPYHIMSFSTTTEQDMKNKIDDYINNRVSYEAKYKLSTKAAGEFYKELTYKGD